MSLDWAEQHLQQAHRTLEAGTLVAASGAWLDMEQAYAELEDAEKRERVPPRELAEAWFRLAHFVVRDWATVALEVGPGIVDNAKRAEWYVVMRDTLKSMIVGYRRLNEAGHLPGPSIDDQIGEQCAALLDTLDSFEHAPVA